MINTPISHKLYSKLDHINLTYIKDDLFHNYCYICDPTNSNNLPLGHICLNNCVNLSAPEVLCHLNQMVYKQSYLSIISI